MMQLKTKASMKSQSQLPKVSTWAHLARDSETLFFSENESLGSASFISLVYTLSVCIASKFIRVN